MWRTTRASRIKPTSLACFDRPSASHRRAIVRCGQARGYDADLNGGDAMTYRFGLPMTVALALLSLAPSTARAQQSTMTFFVTSAGSGKGGDLGGLAGADKQCQILAQAAGAGGK